MRKTTTRICFGAAMLALFTLVDRVIAQQDGAQGPPVRITGGANPEGNFEYQVFNLSKQRITEISFPHFKADMFTTPAGWQQEMTNPARMGTNKPGVARAWVEGKSQGILPGGSAEFDLRTPAETDIPRRFGVVTVRFEDRTTYPYAGVELPSAPTTTEQYQMLIGLGLIFAIIVAARGLRSKRPVGEPIGEDDPGDAPAE
ncbi:MAG: hypothetical protein KDA32_02385 [Phycisphaerales bacterium]|nr:hypothetical protein [Phycisphaerales bacterium]